MWEYHILRIDHNGVDGIDILEKKLNRLGRHGWKLILTDHFGEVSLYYFKRINQEATETRLDEFMTRYVTRAI